MANTINGRELSFTIEGTEYKAATRSIRISNEEGDTDVQTFADLAAGGITDWFIEGEGIQQFGADTFWNYLWDNEGEEVEFVVKPKGGVSASPTTPWFSGTAILGAAPGVGGTAGEVFTFEFRMECTGKPTMQVA